MAKGQIQKVSVVAGTLRITGVEASEAGEQNVFASLADARNHYKSREMRQRLAIELANFGIFFRDAGDALQSVDWIQVDLGGIKGLTGGADEASQSLPPAKAVAKKAKPKGSTRKGKSSGTTSPGTQKPKEWLDPKAVASCEEVPPKLAQLQGPHFFYYDFVEVEDSDGHRVEWLLVHNDRPPKGGTKIEQKHINGANAGELPTSLFLSPLYHTERKAVQHIAKKCLKWQAQNS